MYRSKTVREMQRVWHRERDQYLQLIRESQDRIMHLAGSSWTLPPTVVYPDAGEPEEPDWITDADQVEA